MLCWWFSNGGIQERMLLTRRCDHALRVSWNRREVSDPRLEDEPREEGRGRGEENTHHQFIILSRAEQACVSDLAKQPRRPCPDGCHLPRRVEASVRPTRLLRTNECAAVVISLHHHQQQEAQ